MLVIYSRCLGVCSHLPTIDVGTGGGTGGTCPQDFALNKEVPFLFLENAPFF